MSDAGQPDTDDATEPAIAPEFEAELGRLRDAVDEVCRELGEEHGLWASVRPDLRDYAKTAHARVLARVQQARAAVASADVLGAAIEAATSTAEASADALAARFARRVARR